MKSSFVPNRKFRRDYRRLYSKDPATANLMLLLCEIADAQGEVRIDEGLLSELFALRFRDPGTYSV